METNFDPNQAYGETTKNTPLRTYVLLIRNVGGRATIHLSFTGIVKQPIRLILEMHSLGI
jgi:hypothetical protein